MDLDDEELEATRKEKKCIRPKEIEKCIISKYLDDFDYLDNFEIETNNLISNCMDLQALQEMYIILTNKLDNLTQKRQKEIEGGI